MRGIQLRQEVEHLFEVVPSRSSGDELVFLCPEPGCGDRSGNRSVNLKTGKTSCWRCGKGGNFVPWARRLGYDVSEESIGELTVTDAERMAEEMDRVERISTPLVNDVKLPRGFTRISEDPKCAYSKWIVRMAERKHLTRRDFEEAGVGYTDMNPHWEPFAIFPVVEWDHVVYFQGRRYNEDPGESTKKFPSRKELPFGSRYWVYNIDQVRKEKPGTVIVVESILNVLSLKAKIREVRAKGVVPVAIFKHAISKEQMKKLSTFKFVEEFCLMFDDDATADAIRAASSKSGTRRFTYVEMPEGIDANDDVNVAWERFGRRREARATSELDQMLKVL